jgi:nitrite reductase/ring-hydroxylating ferredoxin subunit
MGEHFVRAASLDEVRRAGCLAVQVNGHTLALFAYDDKVYAVDNRCPHMGFPLDRGTLKDGILTCHWHHARFDLESGGTFDQWADDAQVFPVAIVDGQVMVDIAQRGDLRQRQRERLKVGLERNLSLVIGKAVLLLLENDSDPVEPFRVGLEFGTRYRQEGWGQGLTILTCLMNMLPFMEQQDRPRALYQGLSAVAANTAGSAPRFPVRPLPTNTTDVSTLKRWFRRFVEVRDADGAERCIVSAVRAGATDREMADMLFAAATDHRYIQIGHVADFTNKAFEALDIAGWQYAGQVLPSLAMAYANADRMEEANEWRNPIDLVTLLEEAFGQLPGVLAEGEIKRLEIGRLRPETQSEGLEIDRAALVLILLADNPSDSVEAMLTALREGCTVVELASAVSYAAALRIARFHTSNEFGDWDTALHTFTFANAIEQAARRAPSAELLRGVFDAAMSVYLDRFLNIPAARLPEATEANGDSHAPAVLLADLPAMLDRQQQVNEAGELVAHYLYGGGRPESLMASLGRLLLREDRDFHTIQTVEAAFRQYQLLSSRAEDEDGDGEAAAQADVAAHVMVHVMVAAARYLAAHAPTVRAQGQTYQIAYRLHRGDRLFAE